MKQSLRNYLINHKGNSHNWKICVLITERGHWVKNKSTPSPLFMPYCNTSSWMKFPKVQESEWHQTSSTACQETAELCLPNADRKLFTNLNSSLHQPPLFVQGITDIFLYCKKTQKLYFQALFLRKLLASVVEETPFWFLGWEVALEMG